MKLEARGGPLDGRSLPEVETPNRDLFFVEGRGGRPFWLHHYMLGIYTVLNPDSGETLGTYYHQVKHYIWPELAGVH